MPKSNCIRTPIGVGGALYCDTILPFKIPAGSEVNLGVTTLSTVPGVSVCVLSHLNARFTKVIFCCET